MLVRVLIHVSWVCVCCSPATVLEASGGGTQGSTTSRFRYCTHSGCRLRGQPEKKYGDGYACSKHLAAIRVRAARAAKAAAAAAAIPVASAPTSPDPTPKQTRKRRADSDPGQQLQQLTQPVTRRIIPPRQAAVQKKQKHQQPRSEEVVDVSALLDATHARRMASLAPAAFC